MIAKKYICDDCGATCEFTSYVKARAASWAISRDYSRCYCPMCAPDHRVGGANGKRLKLARRAFRPLEGGEQLSFKL